MTFKDTASLQLSGSLYTSIRKGGFGSAKGCGLLGRLASEKKTVERKITVQENAILERMEQEYRNYLEARFGKRIYSEPEHSYNVALEAIRGIAHTARDIEIFSIGLPRFQEIDSYGRDLVSGPYLSALINHCKEGNFRVHTEGISSLLDDFGIHNTKDVAVFGPLGESCGRSMESGTMLVHGDTASYTGMMMRGGGIIVEGDAGDWTGKDMEGGTLTVKGNSGWNTAEHMKGGKLEVDGLIGELGMSRANTVIINCGERNAISSELIRWGKKDASVPASIWERGMQVINEGKVVKMDGIWVHYLIRAGMI